MFPLYLSITVERGSTKSIRSLMTRLLFNTTKFVEPNRKLYISPYVSAHSLNFLCVCSIGKLVFPTKSLPGGPAGIRPLRRAAGERYS